MALYHPIFPAELSANNVVSIQSLVNHSTLIVNKVCERPSLLRKTKPLLLPTLILDLRQILLLSQFQPSIFISYYLLKSEISLTSLLEIIKADQELKDFEFEFHVLSTLHQVKSIYDQLEHVYLVTGTHQ